ncbi:MAG: alpha/beta fold hydrolase [Litorilinea sp.]
MIRLFRALPASVVLVLLLYSGVWAQIEYEVAVLNLADAPLSSLVDGTQMRLVITASEDAEAATTLSFYLDDDVHHLGDCVIPDGARTCTTAPISTLGWFWDEDGQVRPQREIHVINYQTSGWLPVVARNLTVAPRPVVLVHGFGSSFSTWMGYLGPAGYLAHTGLPGYAVGDGQVPGVMDTGNLLRPAQRTHTIARNSEILGDYIAAVKAETGAEAVDLVVHSMGGLIARYYIDSVMGPRDVGQLIMLGTPNGGSDCAVLAQSLGFYQPASLELRTGYLQSVFNPQIFEARGVPFFIVAGTVIQRRLFSPCGTVPNDTVVSMQSATAVPAQLIEAPYIHTDLTTSEALFFDHVAPLLRRTAEDFAVNTGSTASGESDVDSESAALAPDTADLVQFSQVMTGTVRSGSSQEHTIHIDRDVTVASFGLFDPSRSLTVTVRGATGNEITLTAADNGLNMITDPESLLYLGYGFENPRPGPWQVTVQATPRTPPLGTEYALVTLYAGGATIDAELSNHLPRLEEAVQITATLTLGNEPIAYARARVIVVHPDGRQESIPVGASGELLNATIVPSVPGVYGVDVSLGTILPDGTVAERTVYLAFEALGRLSGGGD